MNRNEKNEKKAEISEHIDLGNGRYKDSEVDQLRGLVLNRDQYNGRSKTYKSSHDGWCSDGKFTRTEEFTYTFRSDDSGIHIDEDYQYHDDDGQSGNQHTKYSTGRDILNTLWKIL